MAGKFINSDQKIMFDIASDNMKSILNNPYYLFSDKKGTPTTYYNVNTTKTTLDEATRGNYSELGKNSPFRFNKINSCILYGITRIDVDYDLTDIGLDSNSNTYDAYVLPNTFIPYPGDFFMINQISSPYLFRVTDVTPNTLDTGSVMYKITYCLAYTTQDSVNNINNQVVKEFVMTLTNDGTNFNAIIESSTYDLITMIEEYTIKLKDYFYMIFYNQKVQSFIFTHHDLIKIYDPYLIEFIIRNEIMKGASQYVFVGQQMYLPSTFGVDYDRTIFSCIEDKDVTTKAKIRHVGNALLCTQKMSLLYAYPEDYYYMEYAHLNTRLHAIDIFNTDMDILYNIRNNIKVCCPLVNIMIKYFNDEMVTSDDLLALKNIDYYDNTQLYYGIPIAIFCLEKMISNMMG